MSSWIAQHGFWTAVIDLWELLAGCLTDVFKNILWLVANEPEGRILLLKIFWHFQINTKLISESATLIKNIKKMHYVFKSFFGVKLCFEDA